MKIPEAVSRLFKVEVVWLNFVSTEVHFEKINMTYPSISNIRSGFIESSLNRIDLNSESGVPFEAASAQYFGENFPKVGFFFTELSLPVLSHDNMLVLTVKFTSYDLFSGNKGFGKCFDGRHT
jgi:hypothetical protein